MEQSRSLLAVGVMWLGALGTLSGQINMDRMVSFAFDPVSQRQTMVVTDADTYVSRVFPFENGFLVGELVCVDVFGDVWCNQSASRWPPQPRTLLHRSSQDGSTIGRWTTTREPSYIAPLQNGNVLVGSFNPPSLALPPPSPSIYLTELRPDGSVVRDMDLATLFPPGEFTSESVVAQLSVQEWFEYGLRRIVIQDDGSIWLHVPSLAYHSLIVLESDWSLRFSLPVLGSKTMLPVPSDGVVLSHRDGLTRIIWPWGNWWPTVVPNNAVFGQIEVKRNGDVGFSGISSLLAPSAPPKHGVAASDGRWYTGEYVPDLRWLASETRWPVIDQVLPGGGRAVHLDGLQRPWFLFARGNPTGDLPDLMWHRANRELYPFNSGEWIRVGFNGRPGLPGSTGPRPSSAVGSVWGNASLHEYVNITDPFGDLDGDGVANRVELNNGSNPLRTFGFSQRIGLVSAPSRNGAQLELLWSSPGDVDRAYVAPIASQPQVTGLGDGHFLSVDPLDPLVNLSLTMGPPFFEGMIGQMDSSGQARAAISLSGTGPISGMTLYTSLVTFEDPFGLRIRSVSPALPFVIP